MEHSLLQLIILSVLGVVAGVINTMSGGGSNLTIPALMVLGMPADIANATNRVGVIFQALVGSVGFHSHGKLPTGDFKAMITPLLIGAFFGGLSASYAPPLLLKYLLLGAMLTVAVIVLIRPNVISPTEGTVPFKVSEKPESVWWLLLAGFYGGFVQAGVGFIIITTLAGILRYDLVRCNAIKVFCTIFFTGVALIIFIYNDQVRWLPGLVLATGTMLGAYIGVKLALKVSQRVMKWFLFAMTLVASAMAILT